MTAAPPFPSWTHKAIKQAIKTFLQSAVALTCLYFLQPAGTEAALKNLRSFTPVMMLNLIGDAMGECEHRGPGDNGAGVNGSPLSVPGPIPDDAKTLTLTKSDLLRPSACRVQPIEQGWPTVGNWVAWLGNHGVPSLGIISLLIALADVTVHLVVAPRDATALAFVGLMQVVFGFAITAAIVMRIDKWLNAYWAALFLCVGTLMIGSVVTSVMLPVISTILAGAESVIHFPVIASIVAIALSFAGASSIIGQLLVWCRDTVTDGMSETLADKAAGLFVRYI